MTVVDVGRFFESVWNQIADAERAADEISEKWFDIADRTLRVRFIGSALPTIIAPALSHLQIAPYARDTDLTIHCWDCNTLGVEVPRAPVPFEAFTPRGEVHRLSNERFHTATEGGVLSLLDCYRKEAVFCVGEATKIQRFHVAEPLKAILSWFMRENGRQLLHAGAVGMLHGGVLLVGRSGAGKSNTSLGCLLSELKYAADDFCVVSVDNPPVVYSLYSTGKTSEQDWDRYPFLAKLAPNLDPERIDKAIYFLNEATPQKLIRNFPLRAIFVLRKGGDCCKTRPISPAAVLRLTAADTARLLPDAGAEVMHCWAQLIRSVPCYEFVLGSTPELIPSVISEFLTRRLVVAL
jgi:hypothetical protein